MIRIGKFDIYWVRVCADDWRPSLLIYKRRRGGRSAARWEF